MPLSRLTQTFPLDLAAAVSESEAAPDGAAFPADFFAGVLLAAGALAGALISDLFAAGVAGAAELAVPESLVLALLFLLFFVLVPVSALAFAESALASADFFLPFFAVVVPVSAFAFAGDWSVDAVLSVLFFLWLFFAEVEPVSAFALAWSPEVVASALFFLDFDFLVVVVVVVSDAAFWSLAVPASVFAFLDFFFVVESVAWSLVLAWGFASAGIIESANNRHRPAIHVLILMGSLCIGSSLMRGGWSSPDLELREARALLPKVRPENAGGMSYAAGSHHASPTASGSSERGNGWDQDSTKTLQHPRAHDAKKRCGVGTPPPPLRLIDGNKLSRSF